MTGAPKILVLLAFSACGPAAPVAPTDDAAYAEAERAFAHGELAEAERRFAELAAAAGDPERRALYQYRRATLLRRLGREDEAKRLFDALAAGDSAERAPLAAFQQAVEAFEAGGGDGALRAVVEAHPDTVAADKALKFLATHTTEAAVAAERVAWMEAVAAQHAAATAADNALWWAAELRLFRLDDLPGARALLRRLALAYPESPLTDDAIWRLAQLHLRQGQWAEAAATADALLKIRNETSYFVGSYRSPYLDDAALLIGRIRYHGLRDPAAAALALEALLAEFPTSVLCDDALLLLAHARRAAGHEALARRAIDRLLKEYPESRHIEAARTLAAPMPFDEAVLAPEPFQAVGP